MSASSCTGPPSGGSEVSDLAYKGAPVVDLIAKRRQRHSVACRAQWSIFNRVHLILTPP
ncbi:MAG: hypothetical protein ACLPN5_09200 [Roseiarcus sp.]